MSETARSPKEIEPARSSKEIEAELDSTRQEMTTTVDELVAQLQPAHQIELAKENLSRKADEVKAVVSETVEAARDGDSEAMKKVGYVIGGVAVIVALIVIRSIRRH